MLVTGSAIALYVAQKCLDQFIKEEVYGRVKTLLFPKTKYINRLIKVINETVTEYEKVYPFEKSGNKIAFYHSEVLFAELLKYILFKKVDSNKYIKLFKQDVRILVPPKIELEKFFELFISKTFADKDLVKLFHEEHYQAKIFEISAAIEGIQELLSAVKDDTSSTKAMVTEMWSEAQRNKLTVEKLISGLNSQVNRQLKSHLNSHKYLPNTFIETGDQKEFLRYLSDSIFYSEKCFEEIKQLDFRLLNKFLKENGQSEVILATEELNRDSQLTTLSNFYTSIGSVKKYLENQVLDLQKHSRNEISRFKYKINDKIKELDFLNSKIALITEYAGQGKTNFLCDFAENFLLKRQIPTVFLTGSEIDANDIRSSIIKRTFPDADSISFSEFLETTKAECYSHNKFFVLIIDGINENINCQILSKNLEIFLAEFLEHDFVKVIVSCRTEYYDQNFSNFEKSAFAHSLKRLPPLLNDKTDKNLKSKLFSTYMKFFKIEYASISNPVYDQLVSNFLLLRIFCEVNANAKLGDIKDLYKEDLFDKYYSIKCEEINKRLNNNDDFKLKGKIDIKNFIANIIKYMIETDVYVNIPISKLVSDSSEREVYIRFLDENILIKRDIPSDENGLFTEEVVNFTFDEFRDFLISKYLIEILYRQSADQFNKFITDNLNDTSPILEGCGTFLFFMSRRSQDETLSSMISSHPWYAVIFDRCIFSIPDELITKEDLKKIEKNFTNAKSTTILLGLIRRYNVQQYIKLNIDFLFSLLRNLDSPIYESSFTKKFGEFYWETRINQKILVDQIESIYENQKLNPQSPEHKLFELLIYMFLNRESWRIEDLYETYSYQNLEEAKRQLRAGLSSKNKSLIDKIDNFIEDYEIEL